MATDIAEADRITEEANDLFIQGTARNIGARPLKYAERAGQSFRKALRRIRRGALCTIIVGGDLKIANAVFQGRKTVEGELFLAFSKNGVSFWVFCEDDEERVSCRFVSIDLKNT